MRTSALFDAKKRGVSARTSGGVNPVRTFRGQRRGGQSFAILYERPLWTALYSILGEGLRFHNCQIYVGYSFCRSEIKILDSDFFLTNVASRR